MRIAFTLMLLFVVTCTASADKGQRGHWRFTPLRPWRSLDGYNVRSPGWDSSYYSPYTPNNTIAAPTLTPTPLSGSLGADGPILNAIPNVPWSQGSTSTPAPTATPLNPSTTQFSNPVPTWNSNAAPATTAGPGSSSRSTSRSPATSASYPRETPPTNDWNSLGGRSP